MIYKISKIEAMGTVDNIPYVKCLAQKGVGIVIWGSHPIGDDTIRKITTRSLPVIVELNPIELEAPYKVQADLGAVISIPADYPIKLLMQVV